MTNLSTLAEKAERYLHKLCVDIPTRRVGSAGNRAATAWFAETVAEFGFEVETPEFECIDWEEAGAELRVGEESFEVLTGPYSLGGRAQAELVGASTLAELEAVEAAGKVLLLHGEIAKEQLMPKNFVLYNPEHHQQIVRLLEEKGPAAIVAATTQDPGLAGAVSPFPLIEDGDFDIPSAYMTAEEGSRLAKRVGDMAAVEIKAKRIPALGWNVTARKGGTAGRRLVFFAHIDAKDGTPGALDNGTGVVILLLLAELLADYAGELGVEIVALNGEDYYAASGEMVWLAENEGRMGDIALGVNMDGVGYRHGRTAYSLYECPAAVEAAIRAAVAGRAGLVEGEAWYQSDHSLFIMNGVPALAFTSDQFSALWMEIAHTPKDVPGIVDCGVLVGVARLLTNVIHESNMI